MHPAVATAWYHRVGDGLVYVPALVAVLALAAAVREFSRRTVGRRRDRYGRLSRLGTNAHLTFFASVLGEPPVMHRSLIASVPVLQDGGGLLREERSFVASIFIDRDFYVEALSDADGSVIAFSVTTRSRRFRPRLVSPGATFVERGRLARLMRRPSLVLIFDVKLAKSRYSELGVPQKAGAWVGARRWNYYEAHWLGNPGHYQWYVFSTNQAGADSATPPLIGTLFTQDGPWDFTWSGDPDHDPAFDSMAGWHTYRARAKMNTYTVIGPTSSLDDYPLGAFFGVDVDHVRTLP